MSKNRINSSIKSYIHLIWIGGPPPLSIETNFQKWKDIYGDRIKIWDNQLITKYTSKIEVKGFHPAKVADICRALILGEYGGWYVDADMEPGNFYLTEDTCVTLFKESSRTLMNGLIYIPKDSTFASVWIREIFDSLNEANGNIAIQTGPMALNRALFIFSQIGLNEPFIKLKIKPEHYVKSATFYKFRTGRKFWKNYVVDHSLNSWGDKLERNKVRKISQKIYYAFSSITFIIALYEVFRYVILSGKLYYFRKCKCNRMVFRNCQYYQIANWESYVSIKQVNLLSKEILRDLGIMKIKANSISVSQTLHKLNWWHCSSHNCFVRPKVTRIKL